MVILSNLNFMKNLALLVAVQYDLLINRKWLTFWDHPDATRQTIISNSHTGKDGRQNCRRLLSVTERSLRRSNWICSRNTRLDLACETQKWFMIPHHSP